LKFADHGILVDQFVKAYIKGSSNRSWQYVLISFDASVGCGGFIKLEAKNRIAITGAIIVVTKAILSSGAVFAASLWVNRHMGNRLITTTIIKPPISILTRVWSCRMPTIILWHPRDTIHKTVHR
jgi:hypothetical protein